MTNDIASETRLRRKTIRAEAKGILIGRVLSHPYFPHDIYINMAGIKEWLNQPHRHYAEKNEALLRLPELIACSEYAGSVMDPKGREYVKLCHVFKTMIDKDDSWIIIHETIWGDCFVHSISDNLGNIYKEQDL